jgi:hypothetical protein
MTFLVKSKKPVYLIRGTGFNIDGSLVTIETDDADSHVTVCPVNQVDFPSKGSILVDRRYLSPASNFNGVHEYTITIHCVSTTDSGEVSEDKVKHVIENASRKVDLTKLVKSVTHNLSPILKAE